MGSTVSTTDSNPQNESPPPPSSSVDASTSTQPPAHRLLAFGDSLTAGYSKYGFVFTPYSTHLTRLLSEQLKQDVVVDELGFSGWTTYQMLNKFDEERGVDVCNIEKKGLGRALKEAKTQYQNDSRGYQVVFVMGGTNDLGISTGEQILENLLKVHSKIRELGAKSIALTVPSNSQERTIHKVRERRLIINQGLKDALQQGKVDGFIDLEVLPSWFDLTQETRPEVWDYDGLHLSPSGYQKIAEIILQNFSNDWLLSPNSQ